MDGDMKISVLKRKIESSTSDNIAGYNLACYYSRILLNFFGVWPDPFNESGFTSNIRILIATMVMFLFITSSQTAKLIVSYKNLNIVIETLANCNIPVTIAIVKLLNVWYNRNAFKNLLIHTSQDWEKSRSKKELAIMWRHARIGRFFSIGCIVLNEAPFTTQFFGNYLIPMIGNVKSKFNSSLDRPLYVTSWFPYDTRMSPNYEVTLSFQLLSTCFASLSFSATDSFFIVLVFHLIGQLSILKVALLELPENCDVHGGKSSFMQKILKIFEMHENLCKFAKTLEESFSIMFLIQIIPCMFVLCSQGYTLIMMSDSDKVPILDLIFMIYFLVLFLLTIFSYCYVAEKLRQKSSEISDAAYNSNWTILPAKEARLLIVIMSRAQRPFKISAGKFSVFSLELYTTIIKTSAGYLSMLLAVKDRQFD